MSLNLPYRRRCYHWLQSRDSQFIFYYIYVVIIFNCNIIFSLHFLNIFILFRNFMSEQSAITNKPSLT